MDWMELTEDEEEQLQLVRNGGYKVLLAEEGGLSSGGAEVQISIYRTGPAYGLWTLAWSSEDDNVEIRHHLPAQYGMTGMWCVMKPDHQLWTVSLADWCRDAVSALGSLVGRRVAVKAAPLLPIPPLLNTVPEEWGHE